MESIHIPIKPNGDGLVLTHGAGGNRDMALLVAVAGVFADAGVTVIRYNLPFRQKRPYGPPPANSGAADREGLRSASEELRKRLPGRVFLGGQSYGGRQASMLAAEDPACADALLLLSYPLHPPDQPEKLRTAHFGGIKCPVLFVHGARDQFATLEELGSAMKLISGQSALSEIPNAGHDLARGSFDLHAAIVKPFNHLLNPQKTEQSAISSF